MENVNETVQTPETEPVEQPKHELGVIMGLTYGLTDRGIGLSYVVKTLQGQVGFFMAQDKLEELINQHKITDINGLVKQTCVIETKDGVLQMVSLV
jgi:hypothetical protein